MGLSGIHSCLTPVPRRPPTTLSGTVVQEKAQAHIREFRDSSSGAAFLVLMRNPAGMWLPDFAPAGH